MKKVFSFSHVHALSLPCYLSLLFFWCHYFCEPIFWWWGACPHWIQFRCIVIKILNLKYFLKQYFLLIIFCNFYWLIFHNAQDKQMLTSEVNAPSQFCNFLRFLFGQQLWIYHTVICIIWSVPRLFFSRAKNQVHYCLNSQYPHYGIKYNAPLFSGLLKYKYNL